MHRCRFEDAGFWGIRTSTALSLAAAEVVAVLGAAPLTYAAVHEMVGRVRARTGVDFTLHMLRHTRSEDQRR